jgi:hypothetical protein
MERLFAGRFAWELPRRPASIPTVDFGWALASFIFQAEVMGATGQQELHHIGPVGPHSVIFVNLAFVRSISPRGFCADVVSRRAFQPPFVEIDDVTTQVCVIL